MDCLPHYGRNIGEAVVPTFQAYAPLLAAQSNAISSTTKKTYSYGSLARQALDVYYSSRDPAPELQDKLMVFLYGGGFTQGDKTLKNLPLVYANVGHFFAGKHGVETIVIDYRLISHGARFPSGGEDLQAALSWVENHYQGRSVFLLGTSAGAMNVAIYLFGAKFQTSRDKLLQGANNKLAGAVLVGMPADSKDADEVSRKMVDPYFGDEEDKKQPIALLQQAKRKGDLALPRVLVLESEFDADIVKAHLHTFAQQLEGSNALSVEYRRIKGHNHFSTCLALGTGIDEEEEWGSQLISWISE